MRAAVSAKNESESRELHRGDSEISIQSLVAVSASIRSGYDMGVFLPLDVTAMSVSCERRVKPSSLYARAITALLTQGIDLVMQDYDKSSIAFGRMLKD
jgi:hypothetical protein